MKKRAKTNTPQMKVTYQYVELDPAEAERRLDAAYDILFNIVFKNEEKPMKKVVSVLK